MVGSYKSYIEGVLENGQSGNMMINEDYVDNRAHKHTIKNFLRITDLPPPETEFEEHIYNLVKTVNSREQFCECVGEVKYLGYLEFVGYEESFLKYLIDIRTEISQEFYDTEFVYTKPPLIEVSVNVYGMQFARLLWEDNVRTAFDILYEASDMIHIPFDKITERGEDVVHDSYEDMMGYCVLSRKSANM